MGVSSSALLKRHIKEMTLAYKQFVDESGDMQGPALPWINFVQIYSACIIAEAIGNSAADSSDA